MDSVKRLSEDETIRPHQIIFKLYKSLWNTPQALERVTVTVEDDIPDLVPICELDQDTDDISISSTEINLQESKVLHRPRFIDLRRTLDWKNGADDSEALLHPHFLVREEYKMLDDYLDHSSGFDPVLLLGQPGIGLSTSA